MNAPLTLISSKSAVNPQEIQEIPEERQGRIDVMDVIFDWNLSYHVSCALQYINHAGNHGTRDLKEAVRHLTCRIKQLEQQE